MSETRRTFTREFKVAAVNLVSEKPQLLRRWKTILQDEGQEAFPGHGNLSLPIPLTDSGKWPVASSASRCPLA